MRLVAVANRTLANARRAYSEAGGADAVTVDDVGALDDAIRRGQPAVTEDAMLLCAPTGSTPSSR